MNVQTIRNRIVELSHHGVGNDVDINAKALAWLNSAYHEIMDDILPALPAALQQVEDITTSGAGTATLSRPALKIIRAINRGTAHPLAEATPADILAAQVSGVAGDPQFIQVNGASVSVFPAKAVTLGIAYIPHVDDLQESGTEASILLPPSMHHILVWGGLVWSALFDRGFASASELALYQRQWLAGKETIKLAMMGASAPVRVKSFNLV